MAELSHDPSPDRPLRCWAEIDVSAIRHNARVAQAMSGAKEPAVIAIVKADAYGHGAATVSRALQKERCVIALAVANVCEAVELRSADINLPIYILGPALPSERAELVAQGFVPVISTLAEAEHFSAIASSLNTVTKVQLVVDTGMGRIGALPREFPTLISKIALLPAIELESVSSHLPSADEDEAATQRQLAEFRQIVTHHEQVAGTKICRTHIANSAGTLAYFVAEREWVRAGLMLYGCSPLPAFQHRLRPALMWKARLTLIRDLPAGHGVSYGRTYVTNRTTVAATISAGYADGYMRHLSGQRTDVLIDGVRCPLLGRVTMDQIVADITHLPSRPAAGTEVILLGSRGGTALPASELATKAGTIPWEILTSISKRVPRITVGGPADGHH